jgi:LPXTG-site transpeptidase (sortase) family protein
MNTKETKRYNLQRRWLIAIVSLCFVAVIGGMIYSDFYAPLPTPKQPAFAAPGGQVAQKTNEQKAAYSVPPTHPRELIIETLGINANIVPVGTLKDNTLNAPKTAWDAGWYDQSALPGVNAGALLLDGHVNDALNTPGVFYKLHTLKTGDIIKIERGDKQLFTYRVVTIEQTPIEQVDMNKLLRPITSEKEGLNLITCGGTYDSTRKTYNDRVLVYTERVS